VQSGRLFLRRERQFLGGNNHSGRPFRGLFGLVQPNLSGGLGEQWGEEHHPGRQQHGPSAEEECKLIIGSLGKQVWHGCRFLTSRQTESPNQSFVARAGQPASIAVALIQSGQPLRVNCQPQSAVIPQQSSRVFPAGREQHAQFATWEFRINAVAPDTLNRPDPGSCVIPHP